MTRVRRTVLCSGILVAAGAASLCTSPGRALAAPLIDPVLALYNVYVVNDVDPNGVRMLSAYGSWYIYAGSGEAEFLNDFQQLSGQYTVPVNATFVCDSISGTIAVPQGTVIEKVVIAAGASQTLFLVPTYLGTVASSGSMPLTSADAGSSTSPTQNGTDYYGITTSAKLYVPQSSSISAYVYTNSAILPDPGGTMFTIDGHTLTGTQSGN